MTTPPKAIARARIAACLQLDEQGRLVQRLDHLNLSGLDLTDEELTAPFNPQERGLPTISLADLPYLRYLDLTGNQLTKLPECVTGFTELVWLGLNFNRITTLPEAIGALTKLRRLYLRGNGLTELPLGVDGLEALQELDGNGNRITQPPVGLLPLLAGERAAGPLLFDLADNGSEWSEIVSAADGAEAQRTALARYLREIEAPGSEDLRQGKLLLVGEGGVGKTTLLDVLEGKAYNDHTDTTHGLELRALQFTSTDGWEGTLHAWDFSGQPAMRQTHQLFFTSPALYLLVWNHREAREAETGAEIIEWLTLIDQRTQGQGRVLLVAKKAKDRSAQPPDYAEIERRFGPESNDRRGGVLLADACLKVDSEGPQAAAQVAALRRRIATYAHEAPSFNEKRPRKWVEAQKHFRKQREIRPYLEWTEFASQCRDTLRLADAEEYARAQHRLGTLVWVDTERLRHVELSDGEQARQLVVLNPDWLSKAVGFIIERDDKDKRGAGAPDPGSPPNAPPGLVSAAQMDAIWSAPPQPTQGPPLQFPADLFRFFRQLMQAFDIARPVRHHLAPGQDWYLVPNRLPADAPAAWRDGWRRDLPQVFWRVELRMENGDPLNHWLGLAIFYRLMIVLHSEVQGRQDFARAAHWRRGFILAPAGGGLARIEFNASDRRDATRCVGFDLQTAAHQPRELWAVFAQALEHLIRDLERHYGYRSIEVKCLVSCPGNLCDRESARRYYIDEEVVAKEAQSGREGWRDQPVFCNAVNCGKRLPLGLLWDGRVSEDPGPLGRIENKLDELREGVEAARNEASRSARSLEAGFADILQRLAASALTSEQAAERILRGQEKLEEGLKRKLEEFSERCGADLREFHRRLADPTSDLPRFYTLMPVPKGRFGFLEQKKWKLWLHCEKTGYPPAIVLPGKQGEFTITESQEFLLKVAPYVRRVSTVLAALGPVTALLTAANPVMAVSSPMVLALAQWAKEYQSPVSGLASLLKEENADGRQGMIATGDRPILAEKEALLWLHNFLRSDPANETRLGLQCKIDGQGQRWWVLPGVEV